MTDSTDDSAIGVECRASAIHGKGAFATQAFLVGDHVGVYVGEPTNDDGMHVLWIETDDRTWRGIDGTGVLRWLNHSKNPNVEFDGPDLLAIAAINSGDELTFHYGEEWENLGDSDEEE